MKRMTIDLPIISEKVGIMLEYLEKTLKISEIARKNTMKHLLYWKSL